MDDGDLDDGDLDDDGDANDDTVAKTGDTGYVSDNEFDSNDVTTDEDGPDEDHTKAVDDNRVRSRKVLYRDFSAVIDYESGIELPPQ